MSRARFGYTLRVWLESSGDHKLALVHTQQVVLAHQPVDALWIHPPSTLAQLARYARADGWLYPRLDLLNRVAQIHIRVRSRFGVVEAVGNPGPGNPAQLHYAFDREAARRPIFFPDHLVDGGFPALTPAAPPLFLDALQAPLQKIDLQGLLADLALQLRYVPFGHSAGFRHLEHVAWTLAGPHPAISASLLWLTSSARATSPMELPRSNRSHRSLL